MLRKCRSFHLIERSNIEGNNSKKMRRYNKNSSHYSFSNLSLTSRHQNIDSLRILVTSNLSQLLFNKLLSHNSYKNSNSSILNHLRLLVPRKLLDFLNCKISRIYQERINSSKEVDQLIFSSIYRYSGNSNLVRDCILRKKECSKQFETLFLKYNIC